MIDPDVLSDDKLAETILALEVSLERKRSRNRIASYFPDDGPSGVSFTRSISSFFGSGKFTWSALSWQRTGWGKLWSEHTRSLFI
jgi:hypothetical protein